MFDRAKVARFLNGSIKKIWSFLEGFYDFVVYIAEEIFSFAWWLLKGAFWLIVLIVVVCTAFRFFAGFIFFDDCIEMYSGIMAVDKVIPDVYFGDKMSVEIREDGTFLHKAGDKEYPGESVQSDKGIDLIYDNGTSMTLCSFYKSDILIPEREGCPCDEWQTFMKDDCIATKLLRKGFLPSTIANKL